MQSSSRVWSADIKNGNIARGDSVEQETDVEPRSCISLRRIRFAVELDPRSINNCRPHQLWTTERRNICCTQ